MMSERAGLLLALAGCAAAAQSEPAEASPLSWKATAEDQLEYDSNPQLGLKRYAPANQFQPDWLNEATATASVEDHDIPLRLHGRILSEAYFHQHEIDTTITQIAASMPWEVTDDDELAPEYSLNNQWYDGHYFEAENRGDLDWSHTWSPVITHELHAFYGELTHPAAYKTQDGYEFGAEAVLSVSATGPTWVREVDIGVSPSRYDAQRRYYGYHQVEVFLDLTYTLPAAIRLLLEPSVTATTYNEPEPGRTDVRRDRLVAFDVLASREILSGLRLQASCELSRNRSSLKAYSFNEAIVGAGAKLTLP
jgi:hypothetical protein